jgi:hypothetical protein
VRDIEQRFRENLVRHHNTDSQVSQNLAARLTLGGLHRLYPLCKGEGDCKSSLSARMSLGHRDLYIDGDQASGNALGISNWPDG